MSILVIDATDMPVEELARWVEDFPEAVARLARELGI